MWEEQERYSLLPKKTCCAKLNELNLQNILCGQRVGEGRQILYVLTASKALLPMFENPKHWIASYALTAARMKFCFQSRQGTL